MSSKLLVLPLAAASCLAQSRTPGPLDKAAGWRVLFDGKSFEGWEDPLRKIPAGDSWVIDQGCLKSVRKPKLREDLFTREKYADFEMAFEWKISPRGNSGVKYRIQDTVLIDEKRIGRDFTRFEDLVNASFRDRLTRRSDATQDYVVGFEYQVIDNEAHADALRGAKYQAASLYDMIPPGAQPARPAGEFNQARIVAKGEHIEHWLNGVKVVDSTLANPEIEKAAARRWGTESPLYTLLVKHPKTACPISLQNHGDEAWFRDIRIRRLK